jgi:multidrug efflux pump subunit AcrA (membrane-fusion protein)
MTKRLALWALLLLAAAAGFFWWWRQRGATPDSATVYRTATVQRGEVTQTVAASGIASSRGATTTS